MSSSALVVGASGLVGTSLLSELTGDSSYSQVIVVTRRSLPLSHMKIRQEVVDFESLDPSADFWKTDDVFCCLGTTIRKAGSRAAFRKVDYSYPLAVATVSRRMGSDQFLLVSAVGADSESRIFYNRTKGEVERDLRSLMYPSLVILRPSLLLGHRQEFRAGEHIAALFMKPIAPLFIGPAAKYRPVAASTVARAMVATAKRSVPGTTVIESPMIHQIAREG